MPRVWPYKTKSQDVRCRTINSCREIAESRLEAMGAPPPCGPDITWIRAERCEVATSGVTWRTRPLTGGSTNGRYKIDSMGSDNTIQEHRLISSLTG